MGWCLNCTCRPHYHIGDLLDCKNCTCKHFTLDKHRDDLDKENLETWKQYQKANHDIEDEDFDDDDDDVLKPETAEISGESVVVFMGKVSRSCVGCGETKLYKEFNNSSDPNDLCNYCLYEESEFAQLDETLTDAERDELMYLEEDIIENEMAFEEAQERQDLIDEFLRGLDE